VRHFTAGASKPEQSPTELTSLEWNLDSRGFPVAGGTVKTLLCLDHGGFDFEAGKLTFTFESASPRILLSFGSAI